MFEKIKKNWSKVFLFALFILYSGVTLIIVTKHESWADEAQAWLIARDLDIIGVIKQMKYEGHSCLWHLVLFPFAHLGFPYETIKYISWAFSVAAVWIILMKSPFNKLLKLIIVFNPAMLYIFPAISRCYCMIPFLISCICTIYNQKDEKPYLYAILIALLANTHVVMEPTAAMLIFFFWGEKLIWKRKQTDNKKIYWKSFIIACLGILLFVAQVLPAIFNCAIVENVEKVDSITDKNSLFVNTRNVLDMIGNYLFNNVKWCRTLLAIAFTLLLIASISNPKQGIIFWIQMIFYIFVHAFVWFMIKQRAYLILLYVLFFAWNFRNDSKTQKILNKVPVYYLTDLALLIVAITMMVNIEMVKADIEGNYSSSKILAKYIEKEVPKNSVFICPNNEKCTSVMPYLNKDDYMFYSPNAKRYYTFVTWDELQQKKSKMVDIKSAVETLEKEGHENIYVMLSKYMVFVEMTVNREEYQKVFEADGSYNEHYGEYEDYFLYKVNNTYQ